MACGMQVCRRSPVRGLYVVLSLACGLGLRARIDMRALRRGLRRPRRCARRRAWRHIEIRLKSILASRHRCAAPCAIGPRGAARRMPRRRCCGRPEAEQRNLHGQRALRRVEQRGPTRANDPESRGEMQDQHHGERDQPAWSMTPECRQYGGLKCDSKSSSGTSGWFKFAGRRRIAGPLVEYADYN